MAHQGLGFMGLILKSVFGPNLGLDEHTLGRHIFWSELIIEYMLDAITDK